MPETTTQYEEIVESVRQELSRGTYQMPGELPYESNARAILGRLCEDSQALLYLLSHSLDERGREELTDRVKKEDPLASMHVARRIVDALLPPTEAGG